MPLQFRRGPDSDRLTITPALSEPVFTTDTKKFYIGDGSTAGGVEIQGSVDSATTIALIDSDYIQLRSPLTTTADFPDSAGVNTLIDARVTNSFINALTIDADTLGGQAASTYLQTTADFPDSAGVNSLIDTRVSNTFINNLTIDADTLGGAAASTYLQTTADFPDSAGVRTLISVTDAGGDGSLAYNNSTGVLTYTGPSSAEVRAHLSAGTGVTYSSGAISIGQAVAPTDSVTFNGLYVSGNFMVSGTTTTINSTTLTVDDKNIVLADGSADANAADSGGITVAGANAQLFYKSTTDAWNFNKDLAMGSNDVSGVGRLTATGAISTTDSALFGGNGSSGGVKIDDGAITIKTGTGSVAHVDFYCETSNAHRVRLKSPAHADYSGNPDVILPNASGTIALTSAIPTNNNTLINGANYLDSTTVTGVITQAYVNNLGITAGLDSALVTQLVDSAYVQLHQSGGAITVQEEGSSLSTSATTLNFVGDNVTASGTGATKTITITSGGASGASGLSRADFFYYSAESGQTSFTGADQGGTDLSYTPSRVAVYLNGILLRDSADYTSTSGDAIVLASGADSDDVVTVINQGGLDSSICTTIVDSAYVQLRQSGGAITVQEEGSSLSTAATTLNFVGSSVTATGSGATKTITIAGSGAWAEKTANYTASAGDKLFVDCSSGVITITLPASPSAGDEIRVIDATGNAATNNITIGRNVKKINSADSDLTLDVNRAAIGLVYYNTAQGWIMMER